MISPEFGGFFILLSLRGCFLFVLQLFLLFSPALLHPAARFSVSIRSLLAASSIRSMALSGRNLSAI